MHHTFIHPIDVRYLEVDQQGVVFNMWYLAYFDDALTAFLAHRGVPYQDMMDRGFDVQLVNTDITWRRGVGWGDEVGVAVSTARLGSTSFVLDFSVRVDDEECVTGRTVYVVVATDGSGKRPIPDFLRAALEPVEPLLGAVSG
ncbi:4-hydroxybenzoyl-CoA thioesterase family active site [Euzebya pacifica]|uniref:4-hydroxybenzoyl-CoA thioesterase family active site n=1 Tax=Euzebya pacifica TaxID=1608957 RepID=A0A346XYL5_9ACTN|nr:thioesterase family protein [Euzebya pacifica]AXV07312.1 4-hydroxybenzoyl-CoA thioesterase family active site [Euzebya pacifica]